MKESKKLALPADGWAGLKENFSADAMAGFSVFLLALPLSLGIAKAGGLPPVMFWTVAGEAEPAIASACSAAVVMIPSRCAQARAMMP
mgnify:CR=1 FL=1